MMNENDKLKNVSIDDLYQVLVQEINLYRNLAEVMREMQTAIIRGDVERLQSTTAREQTLVKKTSSITELRYTILKKVYLNNGIPDRPITLKNLILKSSYNLDNAWTEVEKQLYDLVMEIQNLNQENKKLLEVSLGFIKEIIQRIYETQEKDIVQIYAKDGSVSKDIKNAKHLDFNV